MADKLLVRAYNVEVGDCVYCRIPKATTIGANVEDFHILVDCGSVGGIDHLKSAVANLETLLPAANDGKRRLDLLVVTHEHKDHIAGFDPEFFKNIKIDRIWMNAAMDPTHPQAGRALLLRQLATVAMRNIAALNIELSPELEQMVALFGIDNDLAMLALRETLPTRNGIVPTYVHAGMSNHELGLQLDGATITVLGPENDIDHFYLGAEADQSLLGVVAGGALFSSPPALSPAAPPGNISGSDFRRLQSRMMSSALAFAELSSKVTNNTSVVLLIEWRGKRLLFVGDAEWDSKFKEGKANGSWNVMWHQRRDKLGAPIHFLKIGHHGSENATPWNDVEDGTVTEPSTILDAILPVPQAGATPDAQALVSTKRKNYETIPRSALLAELGKRVANVRNYETELGAAARDLPKFSEFEKQWIGRPQPLRTDCENALSHVEFVEVELEG